jgi:hypothetical protein
MPAAVSAIATTVAEQDDPQAGVVPADLRHVWAQIADPRGRRGRRHSLVVILALVQAAVVAGATSLAAIRHWISAASPQVLADIGARRNPRTGEYQAPHPDTICRVLERLDAAEVDAAYARYRAAQLADLYDTNAAVGGAGELVAVSVDGKSQRGTADGEQTARYRLGAMLTDDGITSRRWTWTARVTRCATRRSVVFLA